MYCIECKKQQKEVKGEMVRGRIWSIGFDAYIPFKGCLCVFHQGEILESSFRTSQIKTPEISKAQQAVLRYMLKKDVVLEERLRPGTHAGWMLEETSISYRLAEVLKRKLLIEKTGGEGYLTFWAISEKGKEIMQEYL